MSVFEVRTIGNTSPMGKRGVFFTCYPNDFEESFKRLIPDVWNVSDCAIYYTKDPDQAISEQDYEFVEKSVNLLIIPVTTNLLIYPNRAFDNDLRFAQKVHIPILPIMMEPELTELYSLEKNFGKLQYLDPNDTKITGLSYKEKLSRFLSVVLIDKETEAKVRNEFDAYIFLSYRKKDRLFADKLMRLIHKNDIFRDTAIWYDEYLTPGEEFDKTISDYLKNSDLFALLVTPSLLELNYKGEKNYVAAMEYPAAKGSGRRLLPIEMEKTDRHKLELDFADIPPCINIDEEEEFYSLLKQSLFEIAVRENDDDPKHLFLIGLAYLDGIDVEKNSKTGIELITKAARSGLIEATEMLVAVYQNGIYHEYDLKKAIEWQINTYNIAKKLFQKTPNEENGKRVVKALLDLGSLEYDNGNFSQAAASFEECNTFCDTLHTQNEIDCRAEKIKSILNLGYICEEQDDLNGADARYKEVADLYLKAGSNSSHESQIELTRVLNKLGDIRYKNENYVHAEMFYLAALKIRKMLAENDNSMEMQFKFATSYDKMGDVCWKSFIKHKSPEYYYKKALEIRARIFNDIQSDEARSSLFESYVNLGNLKKGQKQFSLAVDYYRKALALYDGLKNKDTLFVRIDKINVLTELALIFHLSKGSESSADYLPIAKIMCEELLNTYDSTWVRRSLEVCYDIMAKREIKEGNYSEAELLYHKCLDLENISSFKSKKNCIYYYRKLSHISNLSGDIPKSKSYEAEAQRLETTSSFKYHIIYDALLNKDRANSINETLLENISVLTNDHSISCDFEDYYNDGQVLDASGKAEEAIEIYEKAIASFEKNEETSENKKLVQDALVCLEKHGILCREMGFVYDADRSFVKAIQLIELLETPEKKEQAINSVCMILGETAENEDYKKLAILNKELEAMEAGCDRLPVLNKLIDLCSKLGNVNSALSYYIDKSQKIAQN